MFDKLKGLLRQKKGDEYNNHGGITGFIPAFEDIEQFKKDYKINCSAKTVKGLIQCLEKAPDQKWYVFKSLRKKGSPLNVGTFDDFPTLDQALDWLDTWGGGRYYIKPMSLGKCKIGYYEFEGEDKIPEDEGRDSRTPKSKTKEILDKWKPSSLKEAVLVSKAQDGDEKALAKITGDEEPDDSEGEIGALQERIRTLTEALDEKNEELKEAKDKIDDLKEKMHEKDLDILKERFSAGGQTSSWGEVAKFLNTDAGKELTKEGLDTIKEIAKSDGDSEKGEADEVFDQRDTGRKALLPGKDTGKEKGKKRDWSPLILLLKYIEADGDPNAYIENISVQYPSHGFSQWLITVESTHQFLDKFRSAQEKLPLLYSEEGRVWLDMLFEVIRDLNAKSEQAAKNQAGHETEPVHTETKEGNGEGAKGGSVERGLFDETKLETEKV